MILRCLRLSHRHLVGAGARGLLFGIFRGQGSFSLRFFYSPAQIDHAGPITANRESSGGSFWQSRPALLFVDNHELLGLVIDPALTGSRESPTLTARSSATTLTSLAVTGATSGGILHFFFIWKVTACRRHSCLRELRA